MLLIHIPFPYGLKTPLPRPLDSSEIDAHDVTVSEEHLFQF